MQSHPNLLSSYRADVERYFDEGSSVIIANRDRNHAAILIAALFKKAEKEIVILCHTLDKEFYNGPAVREALLAAVDRGVKLQILVQSSPEAMDVICELLVPERRERVSLMKCKPGAAGSGIQVNFTVVDGRAYRLEPNRETCRAYACANDPSSAGEILHLFKSLISQDAVTNIKVEDLR